MEKFRNKVRSEFKENAQKVARNDYTMIEHLLRQGEKKLEQISSPSVTRINLF